MARRTVTWHGDADVSSPAGPRGVAHGRLLLLVAAVTSVVLVLAARSQIYDTNFYLLGEATSILAGDHPYRDFFEWGAPLAAYLSAAMQVVVGYRLIGEFLTQWLFIVAGVVISFHLGLRLSRSIAASLAVLPVVVVLIAYTPTYHYSKLFFFPATVWLAWRYLDRPGPFRSAVFGATTAVAFLFRHDYCVYIGFAAVVAFVLARAAVPATRRVTSVLADGGAYAAAVALVLAPWMAAVQMNEGLVSYVGLRIVQYERPSDRFVYEALFRLDPFGALTSWLRAPASAGAADNGAVWLREMALLVPIFLLSSAALELWRSRRRAEAVPSDAWRMALAGAFLVVVASALYREPEYVVVAAPLTMALGARYLVAKRRAERGCAIGLLLLAGMAAVVWTRDSPIFRPSEMPHAVSEAFVRLLASPPMPAESSGSPSPLLQYLRDCTAPGDRLLVTGSTPFQVNYYARRPIAGGHLFWRQRWRSDPVHEQQSLRLLLRQSVPFAFSTNDPVLDDFKAYPTIREYLVENYVELEGSRGRLLVDTRRQPTGTFGSTGFPCFR